MEDVGAYKNYLRIDAATLEDLLQRVAPIIVKQDTHMRDSRLVGERLALTLRFLATGY